MNEYAYSHCYVARCPECQTLVAASCFNPLDFTIVARAVKDAQEWQQDGDVVSLVDVSHDGPLVFSGGHAAGCSRGEQ